MDDNQQETIAKLKFLGRVNKGEKINVKEMTLQTESYITSMSRSVWFVDNRNNTLSFIQNTIQAAFALLKVLLQTGNVSSKELARIVVKDIEGARAGITNLKTTYSEDTYFCCEVDTYTETLRAKLMDLKSHNPELFAGDKVPHPPEARPNAKNIKKDS